MRDLAEFLKDTTHENSLLLAELIAAQTVAWAAYTGREFTSLDEIKAGIFEVAGYPMLNMMGGKPPYREGDITVGEAAAIRVAAIIRLKLD